MNSSLGNQLQQIKPPEKNFIKWNVAPPLKIPTTGQRILQTDASDKYWSAILLENSGEKESYYAHASGQFKDAEKNYHVIYKEILAVKLSGKNRLMNLMK